MKNEELVIIYHSPLIIHHLPLIISHCFFLAVKVGVFREKVKGNQQECCEGGNGGVAVALRSVCFLLPICPSRSGITVRADSR